MNEPVPGQDARLRKALDARHAFHHPDIAFGSDHCLCGEPDTAAEYTAVLAVLAVLAENTEAPDSGGAMPTEALR